MTHRRIILFVTAFVAATALLAWLAFLVGESRGLNAAPLPEEPRERAAFVNNSEHVWSCDLFRGFPGLRGNMMERACGEGSRRRAGVVGAADELSDGVRPRLAGASPLDRAFAMNIAGAGRSGSSRLEVPPATTVGSAAGEPAPLGAMLAQAGVSSFNPSPIGLSMSPPGVLGAGPGAPSFTPPGDDPGFDNPPLDVPEVPIPAAMPMMLTGLGGVLALIRRRRRRASA